MRRQVLEQKPCCSACDSASMHILFILLFAINRMGHSGQAWAISGYGGGGGGIHPGVIHEFISVSGRCAATCTHYSTVAQASSSCHVRSFLPLCLFADAAVSCSMKGKVATATLKKMSLQRSGRKTLAARKAQTDDPYLARRCSINLGDCHLKADLHKWLDMQILEFSDKPRNSWTSLLYLKALSTNHSSRKQHL